ncbi:DUF5678 domain-containing protein [Geminocystis sp. CENA526]|uniref:DUF5678 domain-containing protein n=1 Tax=Geminocystis sp. CENA526 TaxID=1355871 RepID=UPI003D6EEA59
MSSATLYPHLERIKQNELEIICLEGTQIPVYWVIEEYKRLHQSVDAVITKLNHLNPSLILSALAYYYDHKQDINQIINNNQIAIDTEIAKSLYPDLQTYHFIQKQAQLFEEKLPELMKNYQGKYVYFENGEVLAFDNDEEKLLDFVEEKYGVKSMFIEKVEIKI